MKFKKIDKTTMLFLLPVILALAFIIIVPFVKGVYMSFTDWNTASQKEFNFVGIDNYITILKNPQFRYSLLWTFTYTIINVILVNAVAILLALAVTRNLKLQNVYRAGFFIPNLIGGIVLGTIWLFIFNLALPHIGDLLNASFLKDSFLNNAGTAKLALVMVGSWQYIGYIMMIYIASIQNIPKDLIEASQIDGANAGQRFRFIVIPMIAQAFTIGTFLTLVNAFKQFDLNLMLTNGGPSTYLNGNSIQSTQLLALDIVKNGQLGTIPNMRASAQAEAIMFFVILFVISMLQMYFTKRREVEV